MDPDKRKKLLSLLLTVVLSFFCGSKAVEWGDTVVNVWSASREAK